MKPQARKNTQNCQSVKEQRIFNQLLMRSHVIGRVLETILDNQGPDIQLSDPSRLFTRLSGLQVDFASLRRYGSSSKGWVATLKRQWVRNTPTCLICSPQNWVGIQGCSDLLGGRHAEVAYGGPVAGVSARPV